MQLKNIRFSSATVPFLFDASFSEIKNYYQNNQPVFITDENVFAAHSSKFKNHNTIVVKAGEEQKNQHTVHEIIEALLNMECGRNTLLVGVGGGTICDMAGYVAGIYKRGIACGLVPTTLLAMVDAAVGGKNGINFNQYKNMVGLIRQPDFVLYDYKFLKSLPTIEWSNGFAEIIKHACIKSAALFKCLQQSSISKFKKDASGLHQLIMQNVAIKSSFVIQDEFETGERKKLNFGHTLGHALEKNFSISHGQAISIGMVFSSIISKYRLGFKHARQVVDLIEKYHLPAFMEFDVPIIMDAIKADKKNEQNNISYILLHRIGKATIEQVSFNDLSLEYEKILNL